jgi:hypothetical protein
LLVREKACSRRILTWCGVCPSIRIPSSVYLGRESSRTALAPRDPEQTDSHLGKLSNQVPHRMENDNSFLTLIIVCSGMELLTLSNPSYCMLCYRLFPFSMDCSFIRIDIELLRPLYIHSTVCRESFSKVRLTSKGSLLVISAVNRSSYGRLMLKSRLKTTNGMRS